MRLPGLPRLPGVPGRGPDAISPTAHYTGRVWARSGLSHPELETTEGLLLHSAVRPVELVSRLVGGPSLDRMLLARHRAIDARLDAAISAGRVTQVVEIASGLSPRGLRFADRVTYVEADLPAMAARKRRALERAGATHRVVEVDAFSEGGLAAVCSELDPGGGVAIITEGLVNYFGRADVVALWERIAATLSGFPFGVYLSDLFLREAAGGAVARVGSLALSAFVRGSVHLHFEDALEAETALRRAGFASAAVEPADGELVCVVEAVAPSSGGAGGGSAAGEH